nr:fimbria/pilus outer membrane usher protein [Microbulbifer rhizosphaerae]
MDSLPGLSHHYDIPTQSLALHVPPGLRREQHLGYRPPPSVEVRRDHGLLFNYDFYAREWADRESYSLGTSLDWFGRYGSVQISGVSRGGDEDVGYRRLDSFWTYSDPRNLWTWTAGDLISGGHSWNRPVRMAGFQWRRNFGVRPDLITLPVPRFGGSAALPSTVELYANNILQYGDEVDPGPFVLDTLPRIGGAGVATLVVTDALGRTTTASAPLYVDHRRLAPGLSDFSFEAGVLRTGFEGGWDDYGEKPVASASWLQGITDTFTFEAHASGAEGLGLAGIGGVWSPDNRWGLLSASIAYSNGGAPGQRDRSGRQYSLGYQWNGPTYGFDLHSLRRSRGYRDLADLDTDRTLTERWLNARDRATVWLQTGRGSLAYSHVRWRDHRDRLLPREFSSTHSVSWTQNFGSRLSVSATVFQDDDSGSGGSLTFSIPLDNLLYAAISAQRGDDDIEPRALLRRTAPYHGGWGWSLQGGDTDGDYAQAMVEVRGRYGSARAGIDRDDGGHGHFFEASGSAVLMDGQLKFSRRIHDAFALVYTGVEDMPVLSENRVYGRTDDQGYLLIPELRGWQRNRIGIDPDGLGPKFYVAELEQFAVPADHAGQLVRFPVEELRPAIVTLLDPSGTPLPAGSRATLYRNGGSRMLPVGFGGEVYIEDLGDGAQIEVERDGGLCSYHLQPEGATEAPLLRMRVRPTICGGER